jgi:hypothetical protein
MTTARDKMFVPTKSAIQSVISRLHHAELLILQLPADHEGRNTWLVNYGVGVAAKHMRSDMGISWILETESAPTGNTL